MRARLLFLLVSLLITGGLACAAFLLPEGRAGQAAALVAMMIGLVTLVIGFLTAAEVLSRAFSRPGEAFEEASGPGRLTPAPDSANRPTNRPTPRPAPRRRDAA